MKVMIAVIAGAFLAGMAAVGAQAWVPRPAQRPQVAESAVRTGSDFGESSTARTADSAGEARLAGLGTLESAAKWVQADAPADAGTPGVRFTYLNIYIDAGDRPLAAYQFNLSITAGEVSIGGIEGGEHAAFKDAYHDPAAIQNDRAIVAFFNTSPPDDLPRGKTRVARIHVQVTGDVRPQYDLKLTVAASADGTKLPADITLEQGNAQ